MREHFKISVVSEQTGIPISTLNRWSVKLEHMGIVFHKEDNKKGKGEGIRLYTQDDIAMFRLIKTSQLRDEGVFGTKKALDLAMEEAVVKRNTHVLMQEVAVTESQLPQQTEKLLQQLIDHTITKDTLHEVFTTLHNEQQVQQKLLQQLLEEISELKEERAKKTFIARIKGVFTRKKEKHG